jgi:mannitol/fructose-specific phosphotransferase system IIA component (Ntr-type)/predicted transcriptional regulator
MQLTNVLDVDQLLMPKEALDKDRLLTLMLEALGRSRLSRTNPHLTVDMMKSAIVEREAIHSTVMGRGLAFPHARIPGFVGLGISIAILKTPIAFGGTDLVNLVCLMVAPENSPMLTLSAMARLTQFFRDEEHRRLLLEANDTDDAMRKLAASKLALDIPITVQDIMTPADRAPTTSMRLREVSRLMHEKNLNVVPVVDDSGKLVGEITCDCLFEFGLPDFFHQLKSVSFIREFDPFEKYFKEESHADAGRLMKTDICVMLPDATLMEAIFALAVKKVSQVYVVTEDGKWVGTVDRDDVLDNVLNW